MSKANEQAKLAAKTAEATETKETATVQAKPAEPTSEKLEALRNEHKEIRMQSAKLLIAGDEEESEKLNFQAYKLQEDIKREIAAIRAHEAELLRKEKEAAIVKLVDDMIELKVASDKVAASKATIDEKNDAYHAFQAAREVVVNRLLGSRPASTATKTASAGTRGATSSEIRQMILDGLAKGQTITEVKADIKAAGYARGTVDTCATNMKKDGEIDY